MTKSDARAKRRKRNKADYYYDYNLLATVILLTCFGLVMLYSTSAYEATQKFGDDMLFFRKQVVISTAAIVFAIIISKFDYHLMIPFSGLLFTVALILMMLVQTPLGVEEKGSRRWLNLGIQFQPSEVAKIAIIVFLPYMIIKMGKHINTKKGLAVIGLIGGTQAAAAKVFTDNLSTALIILGITVVIIFLAHPRTKPFLILASAAAAGVLGFVYYLANNIDTSESFRIRRILTWLRPEENLSDGGYQVMQALYAIGSGGFFGKGLGNSAQKLGTIPEAQNDMIFSIICEELGIFGACIVLFLFGYLLYRLFFIAQNAPDRYGSLVVSGIFVHMTLQVILNICVVINLIPTTGVTLPFISYGGTAILFLMAEMGIALSVSGRIRFNQEGEAIQSREDEERIQKKSVALSKEKSGKQSRRERNDSHIRTVKPKKETVRKKRNGNR